MLQSRQRLVGNNALLLRCGRWGGRAPIGAGRRRLHFLGGGGGGGGGGVLAGTAAMRPRIGHDGRNDHHHHGHRGSTITATTHRLFETVHQVGGRGGGDAASGHDTGDHINNDHTTAAAAVWDRLVQEVCFGFLFSVGWFGLLVVCVGCWPIVYSNHFVWYHYDRLESEC
jgi:hypothetical protein